MKKELLPPLWLSNAIAIALEAALQEPKPNEDSEACPKIDRELEGQAVELVGV